MPELMIFKEVIEQNGVPFTALREEDGQYINGKWVHGNSTEFPMTGVILPLNNDDLKYIESGVYTVKEKKLYVVETIKIDTKVKYKGDTYTIQSFKDLTEYTDVCIYLMRYRENAQGRTQSNV
ncbi:hypothetical protein ACIQXW_06425 [Lysinibacillus sp. NPDC097162]|uniref:hypothetical protein n=1 Tax=Lysinibacillus sp. NPDC097162 TaxID=3364140 RepID=UPI00381DA34A